MTSAASPLNSTLPPGRHGLPREFVVANQRSRLLDGLAVALAEHGFLKVTIVRVTTNASVSRRTFYEHFTGIADATAALLEEAFASLQRALEGALADTPLAPRDAATRSLEEFAAEKPDLLRAMVVDGPTAAPDIYTEGLRSLAELIDLSDVEHRLFVAGGVAAVIHRQLVNGEPVHFPEQLAIRVTVGS